MKRSAIGSFIKDAFFLLLFVIVLKTLLVAGSEINRSAYFNVSPAIRHLSPASIEVSWGLFPEFGRTTHYQVQLNHSLYGSSNQDTRQALVRLAAGSTYEVAVVTFDNGSAVGVSSPSIILMAPPAPQNIGTYSIGSASVGLFWQKVDTAIRYRIYESPDTLLREVNASETRAFLSGFTPGKHLSLKMTAVNATGESFFSQDISIQLLPPPPAFSIVEDQIGQNWFSLKWVPAENAVSYNILINEQSVASISGDVSAYRVENLAAGTAVSVKMSTTNSAGASEVSEALIVQLLPATPLLAAAHVSSYSCTLQWSAANGATYYKIYENNDWAIFNVPSTINNVTVSENITVGMTATYTVVAGNGTGESPHSNPVVVTYTSNSALVRETGDLALVRSSQHEFKDRIPETMCGRPLVWVYFPADLEGPALALEAAFFDTLSSLPEMSGVNFVGVFTRETVSIKGSRRANLEWKKTSAARSINLPGSLPVVRFYSSDGILRNMIRVSMAIISPTDIFKELPEAFEKVEPCLSFIRKIETGLKTCTKIRLSKTWQLGQKKNRLCKKAVLFLPVILLHLQQSFLNDC
jgi:fibronectin type 3 domain-containing protein